MGKPNKPRFVGSELAVHERVRLELEARGWSPARLAKEMTDVGCPIVHTAVYSWINPDETKRRNVSLDEATALARIFGVSLEEMLAPSEAVERASFAGRMEGNYMRCLDDIDEVANSWLIQFVTIVTTMARKLPGEWESIIYAVTDEPESLSLVHLYDSFVDELTADELHAISDLIYRLRRELVNVAIRCAGEQASDG